MNAGLIIYGHEGAIECEAALLRLARRIGITADLYRDVDALCERLNHVDAPTFVIFDTDSALMEADGSEAYLRFMQAYRLRLCAPVSLMIITHRFGAPLPHDDLRWFTGGADSYVARPIPVHMVGAVLRRWLREMGELS